MRNVRHVLRTTLFMMGDVWDVYRRRCVLSTTVMRLIVLMNMIFLIVLVKNRLTVQTMSVVMKFVGMVLLKDQRNVRLEGWDAEDVCA